MPVYFFTENLAYKLSHKTKIAKWLRTITNEHNKKMGTLTYIFCSDSFLLNLNQTYLEHNTLTDIITFPYSKPNDKIISGDIYISVERVGENAITYKATPENEMHRVMAHGLLHLLGYKDKTKAEKAKMRAKEDYCLSLLF